MTDHAFVARNIAAVLLLGAATVTCASGPAKDGDAGPKSATARLEAKSGSSVSGTVRFSTEGDGVKVVADVDGLAAGDHGFHVHEVGDCSAADGESAGDHFAGAGVVKGHTLGPDHGMPDASARHAGDLGNLTADANGKARLERTDPVLTLSGERSVIGRAIVVHADVDDGKDVKSAGARVACGVIVAD